MSALRHIRTHIDDSQGMPLGLSGIALESYGLGSAVGCPASLSPSAECRGFLKRHGLRTDRTVLHHMVEDTLGWYDRVVGCYPHALDEFLEK